MPKDLDLNKLRHGTTLLKRGFAKMQKGGVVMDVTNAEQAAIAEEAGAVAVMALERIPADIRAHGGVARMTDPKKIKEIMNAVTIPVMAKARIGHFVEGQILESIGVDLVDESEVLTPADPFFHIDKSKYTIPYVCGARNLGEAVRRIAEGAAMIRTKGEAGTGDVVEAVRHQHTITQMIGKLTRITEEELEGVAKTYASNFGKLEKLVRSQWCEGETPKSEPVFGGRTLDEWERAVHELLIEIKGIQRLPVVNFAAGGIATPADAAMMMQLGSDGVFVGSGIFKSDDPEPRARAIVEAVTHYDDPAKLADVSTGLGIPMKGMSVDSIPKEGLLQTRGW